MRIIGILLAAYFFVLSVKTCSDDIVVIDSCQVVASLQAEQGHEDAHTDDACSPLCICQCCGSMAVIYDLHTNFLVALISSQTISRLSSSPNEISYSIWQPPKIS